MLSLDAHVSKDLILVFAAQFCQNTSMLHFLQVFSIGTALFGLAELVKLKHTLSRGGNVHVQLVALILGSDRGVLLQD